MPVFTTSKTIGPFVWAVFSMPAAAFAQHAAAVDDTLPAVQVQVQGSSASAYRSDSARSASKLDAPLRDIPQSVHVIPQQLLRDQGARSMQDALKHIPGVGLMAGDGQRDAFVLRGFNALFDVLLDGFRDDAQYFRDLYNIDSIEIIKGPAAVLYGRGSSGGLINRVTKKPDFTPAAEMGITLGSHAFQRGEFALNRPLFDTLSLRLDGAGQDSASYRANAYIHSKALAPSLLWRDGAAQWLLQYDWQDQHRSIDFGVPALGGRPVDISSAIYYGARNPLQNDFSNTLVRQATARHEYAFSDTSRFSNTLRHYQYRLDRNDTRLSSVNDLLPDPTITFKRANVYRQDSGWFNQTEWAHTLQRGGVAHQILAGIELGRQKRYVDSRNSRDPATYTTALFHPINEDLPFVVTTTPLTRGTAVQTTRAAYIQSLTAWTPTIKTLLGLRYDSFRQQFTDTRSATPKYLQRTDNTISPRAGIVWQPTAAQSWYASISRSHQPSDEAQPLRENNRQLPPEQSTNLEIGSKSAVLGGSATFTAALYQLTRTHIKVADPQNPGSLMGVGKQRARGLELGLSGTLARGLQAVAGYSWMATQVSRAHGSIQSPYASAAATPLQGKKLPLSPRHVASVWLLQSLDPWAAGWQAGAGLLHRSHSFATLTNAVTLPAFTTLDLAAYWYPPASGVSLALHMKNALNRKHFISANNDVGIFPGAPRGVEVTLRYAF